MVKLKLNKVSSAILLKLLKRRIDYWYTPCLLIKIEIDFIEIQNHH